MTDTTQFGAREVPLADKQGLVNDVFRSVARRYDVMNDLMSFGLHRAWKEALVAAVNPPKVRPFALLDIAGGTGFSLHLPGSFTTGSFHVAPDGHNGAAITV